MKPHIGILLREPAGGAPRPHWEDIVRDKRRAMETLEPSIDAVLRKHRVPVWVTSEYRPAGADWSDAELEAGLNRIYRLILQHGTRIPRDLLQDIALVPSVERVRPGRLFVAELPPARAEAFGA